MRCRDCNRLSPFPVSPLSRPQAGSPDSECCWIGTLYTLDNSQHGSYVSMHCNAPPVSIEVIPYRLEAAICSPSMISKFRISPPTFYMFILHNILFPVSASVVRRTVCFVYVYMWRGILSCRRGAFSLSSLLVLVLSNFCSRASLAFLIFT